MPYYPPPTPAGTAAPGGPTNSIQFNSAGTAISGSNLLDVDASGNLNINSIGSGTAALLPNPASLTVFSRLKAGRNLLSYKSPSGLEGPYQPMIGMNRVFVIQGGDGSAALTTWGTQAPATTGTITARTFASTNFSSTLRRSDYVASIAAGQAAGIAGATAPFWFGSRAGEGGFYWVSRIIMASTASIASTRMFAGFFTGTAAAPANQEPGAWINAFGVIKNSTGTTYNFFHCDATTANNRQVDTGITYNVGDVLEIRIFAKPSATAVSMSLEVLSVGGSGAVGTGPYADYATSGNLTAIPVNTQPLNWWCYCSTNAAVSDPKIGVVSVYGESDT